jgi:hypothetical protein
MMTNQVSNCVDVIRDAVDNANRAGVLVLSAQQLNRDASGGLTSIES